MSKYSKELDEDLKKRVLEIASEMGIGNSVIKIEPILLKKSKKEIGQVIKGNDLTELYTGRNDIVAVALYEEAFDRVTEDVRDMWIRSLLNQVSYDMDKDKIVITKPELNIPIGIYQKYGDTAVKDAELAVHTVNQIIEEEKQRKAEVKAAKAAAKKAKSMKVKIH